MNVKAVARMLQISGDTVRRWSAEYAPFLSPGASPPPHVERKFTPTDVSVLLYVKTERDTNSAPHEAIKAALTTLQKDGYAQLPKPPADWFKHPADGRIALDDAAEQSQQIAELAATQAQSVMLRERLSDALERVETLERELIDLRSRHDVAQARVAALEVALAESRGEVATFQARLSAYAITGGSSPIPVALIILVTALVVAVLVIVLLVVVRLVL